MNPSNNEQKQKYSSFEGRAQALLSGDSAPREVVEKLQEMGLDREKAIQIVNHLIRAPQNPLKSVARRNMFFGGFLLLFGCLIAIISYVFPSNSEGRVLIICRGAIVFGVLFFFLGLSQYFSKDRWEKEKSMREQNVKIYGVEEPEKTWECPKCQYINSNFTYKCNNCGFSLI